MKPDPNTARVPSYDVDLYDDNAIANPYPHYRAIRDAGPVVWLPRNGLWAIGRFADARRVLRDHQSFSSAQGIAANDVTNSSSLGNTITSDPPLHTRKRAAIGAPLKARALEAVKPRIEAEARLLVEQLVGRGNFDAVGDLARYLPMTIVSDLVGLPEEGRANMLRWAAATFDVLGAQNARWHASLPHVKELHAYCENPTTVGKLRPDGWAAALWQAAQRGNVPLDQCPAMMRDYISPSLDTTILATASLIWLFGRHPEQWDLVRHDTSLIPSAINEAVRLESPLRGFTRVATVDSDVDGTIVPAGARVLVLYASANRDERKWEAPERFDVRREVRDHLGFGFGAHVCAGMHLARMEMAGLLNALAARVERFELGEPVWVQNNVLHGLASLPVSVRCRPIKGRST